MMNFLTYLMHLAGSGAVAGNLLQRKEEPRSLVRDSVPVENEPELVTA
jgi:hypothetical protein